MALERAQVEQMDRAMVALQTALAAREVYWAEHAAAVAPVREAVGLLTGVLGTQERIAVMFLPDRAVCAGAELPSGATLATVLGARAIARQAACVSFERGVGEGDVNGLLEYLGARSTSAAPTGRITVSAVHVASGGGGGGVDAAVLDKAAMVTEAALAGSQACMGTVSDFWSGFRGGQGLSAGRLEQTATGVLTLLNTCGGGAIPLANLGKHDQYTVVHTTNVAVLSAALAGAVGFPARVVQEIALGALLHDVGKQRTDLAVLGKAGKLDDRELAIMRRHPVEGARILAASADVPQLAITIAYEHHMSPDGRGYPALPQGRTIHLASRIVQLADVYDALGTHRPYRKAMGADEIRKLMMEKSGTGYEADLLSVFMDQVIDRARKTDVPTNEPRAAA